MVNEQPPWMRTEQPQQQQEWKPYQQPYTQPQPPQQNWRPAPVQQPQYPQQPQQPRPPQVDPKVKEAEVKAAKKRKTLVYTLLGIAITLSVLFVITVMIFIARYK